MDENEPHHAQRPELSIEATGVSDYVRERRSKGLGEGGGVEYGVKPVVPAGSGTFNAAQSLDFFAAVVNQGIS